MFVFLYVLRYRFFRMQRARAHTRKHSGTHAYMYVSILTLEITHIEVYTIFFIFVRISRRML